jgi:transposase
LIPNGTSGSKFAPNNKRNRIERFFNKIKHSHRIAVRYNKLECFVAASTSPQSVFGDAVIG